MASIGDKFKKAREAKGLSIEDVSFRTKIHPKVVRQIEDEKFDSALSPVYIKGFLRRYAQFLGLDSDKIICEYAKKGIKAPEQILELKPKGSRPPFVHKLPVFKNRRRILVPAALAVLLFIIIAVMSRREAMPPRGEKSTPHIKAAKKPKSGEVKLIVYAKEDVWMEVRSDGDIVFRHILPKGSREVWSARRNLRLWVGKAEALDLVLDGEHIGSPGRGVIKDIVITNAGLKINK